MIKRYSGEPNIRPYAKAASTAFALGDLVTVNGSGYIAKASSTDAKGNVIGSIQRSVTSDHDDYADNSIVSVDEARQGDEFVVDVGNGTASQSDVGSDYDLNNESSVDMAATATGHIRVTRFISSSKVIGRINQ